MENLERPVIGDPAFWRGRRVLLTGHTGFKGAWAALALTRLGARVTGLALPPDGNPNLFALASVSADVDHRIVDLRDPVATRAAVAAAAPQIIIHMAARALVRESYEDPIAAFATNVMGSVHLLDAARRVDGLAAVLVVTSDKVYANDDSGRPFVESDRLGGRDPYSASKAATEIATAAMAASYFDRGAIVATARGGNVIGGGDFSRDRIVPDIWRAAVAGEPLVLRNPDATRPWQHVLDCLGGYFRYVERLVADPIAPRALNIGPDPTITPTVRDIVEAMQPALRASQGWRLAEGEQPREMKALALDPSLSRRVLDVADRLPGKAAMQWTAAWYRQFDDGADPRALTLAQIEEFERLAPSP